MTEFLNILNGCVVIVVCIKAKWPIFLPHHDLDGMLVHDRVTLSGQRHCGSKGSSPDMVQTRTA